MVFDILWILRKFMQVADTISVEEDNTSYPFLLLKKLYSFFSSKFTLIHFGLISFKWKFNEDFKNQTKKFQRLWSYGPLMIKKKSLPYVICTLQFLISETVNTRMYVELFWENKYVLCSNYFCELLSIFKSFRKLITWYKSEADGLELIISILRTNEIVNFISMCLHIKNLNISTCNASKFLFYSFIYFILIHKWSQRVIYFYCFGVREVTNVDYLKPWPLLKWAYPNFIINCSRTGIFY